LVGLNSKIEEGQNAAKRKVMLETYKTIVLQLSTNGHEGSGEVNNKVMDLRPSTYAPGVQEKGVSLNPDTFTDDDEETSNPGQKKNWNPTGQWASAILTELGPLHIDALAAKLHEKFSWGSGEKLEDRRRLYSSLHRNKKNFRTRGRSIWEAKRTTSSV
jgi:hypothetical protein